MPGVQHQKRVGFEEVHGQRLGVRRTLTRAALTLALSQR
jgi:hypothetical protein